MASLQLQQFCCPQGSAATRLLRGFQPRLWNGLCLGSAALGLAGLLLQALARRRRGWGAGRGCERRLHAARGILAAITASSWLGTAGILTRSVLWLADPPGSADEPLANGTAGFAGPLCTVAVMWVQYFYTAHFWALFCYALEAVRLLRSPAGCRSLTLYYLLCWGLSSTQCLWGLQQLLDPAPHRCEWGRPLGQALAVAHYTAAYVPLSLALCVNPLLLARALRAAPALLRRQTGRYGASERLQEQQLRGRFTSISITFTACWLANVANDGLLLLEPAGRLETRQLLRLATLCSWSIAALLNPVAGLLLSLALAGWQCPGPTGRAAAAARTPMMGPLLPAVCTRPAAPLGHPGVGVGRPRWARRILLAAMDGGAAPACTGGTPAARWAVNKGS